MKRFLVFVALFVGIALGVPIAIASAGPPGRWTTFVELAGWVYAASIIPVLICVHRLLRQTRVPPFIGTGLAAFAMAALVFPLISYGSDFGMVLSFLIMPFAVVLMPIESATLALSLTFGLIVGMLAALCSGMVGPASVERPALEATQ